MKRIHCFLLIATAISTALAQVDQHADMKQLKKLNAQFIENFVKNDTVSHSKIIHKDFVCIGSDGKYYNRQDYLNGWLHGFDDFTYWDYRDEQIKIFGNTALVHAKNKYSVLRDGKEITGMSMYTDIYIKEDGEWKCIQAQVTKVTAANDPGDETIVKKYDNRIR